MNAVGSVEELAAKSRQDLTTIMESGPNADRLFDFFHQSYRTTAEGGGGRGGGGRGGGAAAASSTGGGGTKANFKYFKRKKK